MRGSYGRRCMFHARAAAKDKGRLRRAHARDFDGFVTAARPAPDDVDAAGGHSFYRDADYPPLEPHPL
ncbi:MAG: hypothetical protein AVDCRST_MAG59-2753 [uncultured Thermomicrobiales bacterium]|uniref:Uncharacterized protein n=1 Tax=uncultured Thermomicrobiales bacterium TaxID=1645740 RepID=A0A6J4UX05_9BACT|nr:MAG: hypothetical protein AVDCRST_MAG59-2753 [uncultured Thermomicrobiales bacterium]